MLAKVCSAAVNGIEAYPVEVEVNAGWGDTIIVIVGLPDAAVKESRDRVTTALTNSGFKFPMGRTTINLAPADVKKEGPSFDLPIAIGMLAASEQMETRPTRELHHGRRTGARPARCGRVKGVLPIALRARAAKARSACWFPPENAAEAAVVAGLQVIPVQNLREAVSFLEGEIKIAPDQGGHRQDLRPGPRGRSGFRRSQRAGDRSSARWKSPRPAGTTCCSSARRAPANRCWRSGWPTILPPLTLEEALETTKIHSIVGLLAPGQALVTRRPFRAPHHTASDAGLLGGNINPTPGEISLAHHGVLVPGRTARVQAQRAGNHAPAAGRRPRHDFARRRHDDLSRRNSCWWRR